MSRDLSGTRSGRICRAVSGLAAAAETRLAFAAIAGQAFGLLHLAMTARLLDAHSFALFTASIMLVGLVTPLFAVGVSDAALTQALASAEESRPRIFSAMTAVATVTAVVTTVAVSLAQFAIPTMHLSGGAVVALAVFTLLSAVSIIPNTADQLFGRYDALALTMLGVPAVTALLTMPFKLGGLDGFNLSTALSLRSISLGIAIAARIPRYRHLLVLDEIFAGATQILARGFRFHLTAVLSILSTRLDQILSLSWLTVHSLAVYGAITPFGAQMRVLGTQMGVPAMREVATGQDPEARLVRLRSASWRSYRLIVAVTAVIATGSVAVAYLAFGSIYRQSVWLAPLAVITGGVFSAAEVTTRLLRTLDLVWPAVAGRSMSIVVGLVLGAFLAPGLQVVGILIASAGAGATYLVLQELAITRRIVLRTSRPSGRFMARATQPTIEAAEQRK